MTRPDEPNRTRGVFIHGDRNEMRAPQYSIADLERYAAVGGWFPVEEITPDEVLQELANWPDAVDEIRKTFERHKG